ncbi:MAG: PIG-L deacetylase family protein [Balneolaceae bacterium]
MSRILYIFPHPDDESFGPAPAISAQRRQGHEVYLLTLTKGEATKQRFRLGLDKKQMGEVRYREMKCVEKVLDLSGMTVLDLPDGELKKMDPLEIEEAIAEQVHRLRPDVLVTYAVHGVSGFHDHLVSHAVVKSLFCRLRRDGVPYAKRLALYTRTGEVKTDGKFRLEATPHEEIAFTEVCTEQDMERFHSALDCYETYQEVIEQSKVKEVVNNEVPFEVFGETFTSPLESLDHHLP